MSRGSSSAPADDIPLFPQADERLMSKIKELYPSAFDSHVRAALERSVSAILDELMCDAHLKIGTCIINLNWSGNRLMDCSVCREASVLMTEHGCQCQ